MSDDMSPKSQPTDPPPTDRLALDTIVASASQSPATEIPRPPSPVPHPRSLPRSGPSRLFLFCSGMLIVILGMSILMATRLLMQRRMAQRLAIVAGSSMEPCLFGPRLRIDCPSCKFKNQFALDAWQPNRPTHCLACGTAIEADDPPQVLAGQIIAYAPLPHDEHAIATLPAKLHRWDVVILRRSESTQGEIKRVVGLPGESVAIRDGHVWIDGHRATKTHAEFLEQAILVGHWSNSKTTSMADWLNAIQSPLYNDLPINPHDSHALLACEEFGVSLRISAATSAWECGMRLATIDGPVAAWLHRDLESLRITFDDVAHAAPDHNPTTTTRLTIPANWRPKWLHWIVMDGRCLIADDTRCLGSIELVRRRDDAQDVTPIPQPLATCSMPAHGLRADLGLVYRGRVMRGYGDTSEVQFPDGGGLVVLGDNVSISDDSRGAGTASARVPLQAIRGRWIAPASPMESLLAQSAAVPGAELRAAFPSPIPRALNPPSTDHPPNDHR